MRARAAIGPTQAAWGNGKAIWRASKVGEQAVPSMLAARAPMVLSEGKEYKPRFGDKRAREHRAAANKQLKAEAEATKQEARNHAHPTTLQDRAAQEKPETIR